MNSGRDSHAKACATWHRLHSVFVILSVAAIAADVKTLSLTVGKGELLQFDRDVVRVAIAEPKIADAVIVSPRDVMVNAKGSGHTTLIIWEGESAPQRWEISVLGDATDAERLQRSLDREFKTAFPGSEIGFSGNGDSIVLHDHIDYSNQLKRAEPLAATDTTK